MSEAREQIRNILLVDDDPLVVKVYAERMRFEGWNVAVARDGWDACQEAKTNRYDMILLDIRMPFQDGVEVLKEIRNGELNAVSPIYILTGLKESEEVDDALRLGAEGVFYKAENRPDELVSKIRRILARGSETSNSPRDPSSGDTGSIPALPDDVPAGLFDPVEEPAHPTGVIDREPDFDFGFFGPSNEGEKLQPNQDSEEEEGPEPAFEDEPEKAPAAFADSQEWPASESEPECGSDSMFDDQGWSDPAPEAFEEQISPAAPAAAVAPADPEEPEAVSAPAPAAVAAPAAESKPALVGRFRLYVNPFLGDGAKLSETLGLKESYICPECSGQICLDLDAGPDGIQAHFVCSRCKAETF